MGKSRKPGLCEYLFPGGACGQAGVSEGSRGDLAEHGRRIGAGSLPGAWGSSRPKEGFFSSHDFFSGSKWLWASSCWGAGSRRSAMVGMGGSALKVKAFL